MINDWPLFTTKSNNESNNKVEIEKRSQRNSNNDILYSKNSDVYKRIHTFLYNKIYYEDKRLQVLTLRVKPVVKMLWDTLSIEEKRLLREAIEKLVLGYVDQSVQETKIINVNINVNKIENNVKAESNVSVNIDVSEIFSEISEIKKLISNWHRMKLIPKAAYDTVSSRLKRIEKMIKQVN